MSVDQALRKAKRHAKRGEVDLAAQLYESVLLQFPKNQRAIEGQAALRQLKTVKSVSNASPSQQQIQELIDLYNQGKLQEALVQGEALTQQFPESPFVQNLLGVVTARLGHLEQAASRFAKAVRVKPDYAEAHKNLGNARRDLGELEQAASSYRKAVEIKPDYAEVHRNLGNVLADLKKPEEAVTSYRRALEIRPDYAQAQYNLGNALRSLGKLEEAVACYQRAVAISPNFVEAHNNLGNVLEDLRKPEAAVSSYVTAITIDPNCAEAHNNLGNVLRELRKPEAALASCNRAIEIKPDYFEAHNNRGFALRNLGKFDEALASYHRALEINPSCTEAHNNLGNVLRDLRKPEESVASYNTALEIDPSCAEAHNNLGIALNNLGKFEEAVSRYYRALEISPDYAAAHRNLSTAKKYHEGDPQIGQMLQLVERNILSNEERMHLNFALGKAYGDIGNYDQAYSYLSSGNGLRKELLNYDISPDRELFAEIRATFSKDLPPRNAVSAPASRRDPQSIFVLGMPRSGTTLVEQILASHSQVYGAGELDLLNKSIRATDWRSTQLSSDRLHSLREAYFLSLQEIGAAEPYVTDKQPFNFRWIGFILTAIPEAKIVHVKRDARATCWSNFKHCFSSEAIGFAYDFQDIVEYYNMYIDLMAFWHEKFPGRIYDLDYETLTEHQEVESRKLLEFVGLNWEDQCLEFYKTKRAVQTASDTQVRQKMYQGSSDEWRKYEKHLDSMLELLGSSNS